MADIAINTWKTDLNDVQRFGILSWQYGNVISARLGQLEDAVNLNIRKFEDCNKRFPVFWGPGWDFFPDHNWGGTAMMGLQEMALQTYDDVIQPYACWPNSWDCNFKLHAPMNTVVEARMEGGVPKYVKFSVGSTSVRKRIKLNVPGASKLLIVTDAGVVVPSEVQDDDMISFGVQPGGVYYALSFTVHLKP